MNLGLAVLFVSLLGYISNWLNWHFLNNRVTAFLYYIGALVHETSHAVLCVLTGARIEEFSAFSSQPHVTHRRSRIPIIGEVLISFAPIAGGILFLFLINTYLLKGYFTVPRFSGWQGALSVIRALVSQLRLFAWQSWVMAFLFLNVGAMIGPSFRDLKNIWFVILLLFFVQSGTLVSLCWFAAGLILVNIALQAVLIAISSVKQRIGRR